MRNGVSIQTEANIVFPACVLLIIVIYVVAPKGRSEPRIPVVFYFITYKKRIVCGTAEILFRPIKKVLSLLGQQSVINENAYCVGLWL